MNTCDVRISLRYHSDEVIRHESYVVSVGGWIVGSATTDNGEPWKIRLKDHVDAYTPISRRCGEGRWSTLEVSSTVDVIKSLLGHGNKIAVSIALDAHGLRLVKLSDGL